MPHSKIDAADVTAALELLGDTAEMVAETLVNKGIPLTCDERVRAGTCPIATYLNQQFPEATWLMAGTYAFTAGIEYARFPVPLEVYEFVRQFDRGRWAA